MARIGGGIEQLEALRASFIRQSEAVEGLRQELASQLGDTDWEGPAADRFRSAWSGEYEPGLRRFQSALQECSTEVERRRQALVDAGG